MMPLAEYWMATRYGGTMSDAQQKPYKPAFIAQQQLTFGEPRRHG